MLTTQYYHRLNTIIGSASVRCVTRRVAVRRSAMTPHGAGGAHHWDTGREEHAAHERSWSAVQVELSTDSGPGR